VGFTPYRLYHKPPLRGGTFHKRDKTRFLTAFSCNHFLETPQAECWPLGREPKPPA